MNYDKHCCVNAILTDPETGKVNSIYRCMNEHIADLNMGLSIEGLKVEMKCVDNVSGASNIYSLYFALTLALMSFGVLA
jgi:hypothetical protein